MEACDDKREKQKTTFCRREATKCNTVTKNKKYKLMLCIASDAHSHIKKEISYNYYMRKRYKVYQHYFQTIRSPEMQE